MLSMSLQFHLNSILTSEFQKTMQTSCPYARINKNKDEADKLLEAREDSWWWSQKLWKLSLHFLYNYFYTTGGIFFTIEIVLIISFFENRPWYLC